MLAVLSVLFITLVFLPQTAMAKAWKAYVVEDDTTLTFYYDAKWGTRPGTTYDIDDKRTDDREIPAWAGSSTTTPNARITKVVFDSSFKAYKPTSTRNWFLDCTKVVSFEGMENLCTDQVTDMFRMFCGCESLKTIDVSYFNTAKVRYMEYMFAACYKLTTIYCDEDWDDGNNRGAYMFRECNSLKGIAQYQDYEWHEDMANAAKGYFTSKAYVVVNDGTLTFYYGTDRATCTGSKYGIYETWPIKGLEDCPIWTIQYDIKKVVFDKSFQVFKPTTTKKWFSGFGNLSSILYLDYLCTDRVTTMNGMFQNCSSLPYINMVNFNTSNVTDMSAMFFGCSSLTRLNVTNFDVSKVTNMSEMFYGCTALEKIYCNDDWTSSVLQDGNRMFSGCEKLRGEESYNSLKTDALMANPTSGYFKNTLYVLYKDNTLTFYNDESKGGWLRTGTAYLFDENLPYTESPAWLKVEKQNVKKVVFDSSFKTVRPTNMGHWFDGFENLTTIEGMENLCTDSVESMLDTFYGCSSLTSIDLSHFNTKNVNVMQGMFDGCSALTTLDVSNFDMSKMININSMFRNCTALTTIYSSDDWNSSTLENSFLMFENCPKLKGADAYNANNTGASMANPTTGYFTAKTYVEYKDNTLTFYCDNLMATRSGTVYVLDENLPDAKSPAWLKEQKNVRKVVFDSSFKDSKPTTMMNWFYGFENLTTIEGMENLCTDRVVNMA